MDTAKKIIDEIVKFVENYINLIKDFVESLKHIGE